MQDYKPHIHAELIKAWADGAIIQYINQQGEWVDVSANNAAWFDDRKYRVKPKDRSAFIGVGYNNGFKHTTGVYSQFVHVPDSIKRDCGDIYSDMDVIELIIDSTTGKIKDCVFRGKR